MIQSRHDDVLVVAPVLNEARHLPQLLPWLAANCGPQALIVIADGGSKDGSQAMVQSYAAKDRRFHLMPNPRKIQSAGVNAAVTRFGNGRRWLVRIDAHAGYRDGFVQGLISTAERTGACSVVIPMHTVGEGCFQRAAATAQNSVLGTGGAAHRSGGTSGFVDHGHHALMTLDAFRAVGGYDEGFSHNEDAELDLRFARAGAKLWLAANLPVDYHPRSRPGALFNQYLNYGRGRAMTVARHQVKLKLRQRLPLLVAPAVLLAVPALLTSLAAPLSIILALPAAAWAGLCLTAGALLGLKTKDVCAAGSGVAAMIMHLAWSLGFWRQSLAGSLKAPLLPLRPLTAP